MNNYIASLALTYFKEKREKYSISELMEMLGYNLNQIDELIYNLMHNEYLCYIDNLLSITKKGLTFLISNDNEDICLQADDYVIPHIDPQKALPIDTPYVPDKFVKKYKG